MCWDLHPIVLFLLFYFTIDSITMLSDYHILLYYSWIWVIFAYHSAFVLLLRALNKSTFAYYCSVVESNEHIIYLLCTFVCISCYLTMSESNYWTTWQILSQPNNNHNPNNKTTITVVGLRLSNRWEHHPPPPPPPQTQNYMIEQK